MVGEEKKQTVIKNASVSLKNENRQLMEREELQREGRKIRNGGYLVMQGRTDESLGFGCCYKLKHLPLKDERFTWSARDT